MSDLYPPPDTAATPFRELRGEYVENRGQVMNVPEFLDYFEPLGSVLARQPDGVGGPFVHRFTDGSGRTIGALGWVVSAASKRFGGWNLWGIWCDRAMPPAALPLLWTGLAKPDLLPKVLDVANEAAPQLFDSTRWDKPLPKVNRRALADEAFRTLLKAHLSRVWALPAPHVSSIEVELTPQTLDLLPWIYLLGPVDPAVAQLQPSRFNTAGYQYILGTMDGLLSSDVEVTSDVDELVELAATSALKAHRRAAELRAQRAPRRRSSTPVWEDRVIVSDEPAERSIWETNDMPKTASSPSTPSARKPSPERSWPEMSDSLPLVADTIYRVVVIALLAWIAWNVNAIRKATVNAPRPPDAVSGAVSGTAEEPAEAPPATQSAAAAEDAAPQRARRLATALAARPPQGMRVDARALDALARGSADPTNAMARVAIEVYLRRNGCHARTEPVDARFSTAEQRAIRGCALLEDERLMRGPVDPDAPRALAWLERLVSPSR